LEAWLVCFLFLSSALVVSSAFVAALCHLLDPQARWPRDYAAELKQVAADVGDSWRAVLFLSLIVFYRPIRGFLDDLAEAGPLKRRPPTNRTEVTMGPR
jgi:hypothetical protein